MKKLQLLILCYLIVVIFCVMYAAQPLQPLLANEFKITMLQASQFTAIVMLFLAISPLIYGYILETINVKKMLFISSFILLGTNILLSQSQSYESFLLIRTIESILIPAILTALMSLLAHIDKDNIKYNMAIYVAATVFGGLIGRVASGYVATQFGWREVFLGISFLLFIGLFLIKKINYKGDANLVKPKLKDITNILKDRRFMVIYFLMFSMFFVFAGLLNVLPFRMKDLDPSTTEAQIGFLYLGYGMGIVVALLSKKIILYLKGETNAILLGGSIFLLSTLSLLHTHITFVFFMLFIFCMGMFTVHSVSTGIANTLKESQKSLTSGIYLTFYYIGGFIGSIIPIIIYENMGWNSVITLFILLLLGIYFLFFKNQNLYK